MSEDKRMPFEECSIGCKFANCPSNRIFCPCKLCLVKPLCDKSCIDRIRAFDSSGNTYVFKNVF